MYVLYVLSMKFMQDMLVGVPAQDTAFQGLPET